MLLFDMSRSFLTLTTLAPTDSNVFCLKLEVRSDVCGLDSCFLILRLGTTGEDSAWKLVWVTRFCWFELLRFAPCLKGLIASPLAR